MDRSSSRRAALPGATLATIIVIVAGAALTIAANAQGGLKGFRTPSGNIHCLYYDGKQDSPPSESALTCDIFKVDGPLPAKPQSCDGDWGHAFSVGERDIIGQMVCATDSNYNDQNPVLGYGQTWQHGGFTCVSQTSGLTCFNAQRHGFKLSKASRTVF